MITSNVTFTKFAAMSGLISTWKNLPRGGPYVCSIKEHELLYELTHRSRQDSRSSFVTDETHIQQEAWGPRA